MAQGETVEITDAMIVAAVTGACSFIGSFAAQKIQLAWLRADLDDAEKRLEDHAKRLRHVEIKLGN